MLPKCYSYLKQKGFIKFLLLLYLYSFHVFQVNYINAHATSTLAGDLAEINAIKKVFKSTSGIKINATKVRPQCSMIECSSSPLFQCICLLCISCKWQFLLQSMIGHCLGAAGGLEAIATVKAINTGWLHPSINQFVRITGSQEKASLIPLSVWPVARFELGHFIRLSHSLFSHCRTQNKLWTLTRSQTRRSNTRLMLVSDKHDRLLFGLNWQQFHWLMSFCFAAAISNSFGFGGHNSVVAFSAFKPWFLHTF